MHEKNDKVNSLICDEKIPKMITVRQKFDEFHIEDPISVLRDSLNRPELANIIKPGMSIAVTAGSRGIDNIAIITRETIRFIKEKGGEPFIVPSMGSHGGAVAEGQVAILKSLGITEKSMGCPIHASMEVDLLDTLEDGTPVYIDKYAHAADGIVVINRIKPHTGFRGRYESGLFKMMTIGLGKQKGAETTHNRGRKKMGESIELSGSAYLNNAKILFGVATIENAFDRTYKLLALTKDEIRKKEPEYLVEARSLLPCILLENLDVLVIDYMGKNISGTGMDTNITKSYTHGYGISREGRARKIAILDLTDESHGAAVGVGSADITTRELFKKMDFNTTYPNLLTTGGTDSAKIPMVLDNHKLAIQAAIKTAIGADKENIRMIRIRDTLHISEIQISEALLKEAEENPLIEIIGSLEALDFDEKGNLF